MKKELENSSMTLDGFHKTQGMHYQAAGNW